MPQLLRAIVVALPTRTTENKEQVPVLVVVFYKEKKKDIIRFINELSNNNDTTPASTRRITGIEPGPATS